MPQHRPPVPILVHSIIVVIVSISIIGYLEFIASPTLGLKPSHATLENVRLPTMPAYAEASATASMVPMIATQHTAPPAEVANKMTTIDAESAEEIREAEMFDYLETSNANNVFGDRILNCAIERYVNDRNTTEASALQSCLD